MANQKVPEPRWQTKPMWTARRLTELSKQVGKLRQEVRVAEDDLSKAAPSGARRSAPGQVPQQ